MNEESIFAAALEKTDPSERAAYLDETCGGDPDLRRQVESLLQAHHGAGSFLEEPVLDQVGTADEKDADATLAESAGDDLLLDFLLPPSRAGALGRLKHYEILEVIGRGGMGVVFKATDEVLQRVVAVKVMAPQLAASAAARKRFIREAQAAAAVRDEHVVDIHAVDEVNGLPYLVMELVTGMSLQERLDREGPLELKEVLRIGMQTAAGLAAAHRQGLVHRDIKPANILLENGVQRVKLTDFGLARAVDDASLTQSGVIAGTPMYMAPEQARGEPIDHRADLFSLGSVLYAMCTGHPPFRAGTALAVLRRVSEDSPRPLREINPDVPTWLAAIIARLHAKDPAGRFSSAKEVGELLEQNLARLQQPSPPAPPQPAPAPPARPRLAGRWAAAAAVLLLALAGLGTTETLGVTHVRDYVATVLRIGTPDGTLVVEVNDPGVKVTIDGDGDEIAITGAGPQEVRLRPGRYRLRASKDGVPLPLDNDLVTITRGGRQLVKVSREPAGAQASSKDVEPQAMLWGPAMAGVAFSPDGRSLAVGSANTVQVWDRRASTPRLVLRGHQGWVWTVAFSPDGHTLASASMDSTIKLWDLAQGKERLTLKGHTDKVWSVAFSGDGKTLVSASDDGTVRLWDAATGKQQKLFGGHNPHAYSAELTPDGKTLVSGAYDGDVRLWDVAGQKVVATLPGHSAVVRLALSADGKTLASASHDRTIRLWDLGTRQLRRTLTGHTLPIERVALSPDGKLLATVSGDYRKPSTPGEIKVWEVASGKEVLSLNGHQGPVHGVAFAPDGKMLATASADGTVKLWDLRRWALRPSTPATGPLPFVVLARGGRAEQGFPTLAEAVAAAASGDVIEVRGDGPFVSQPIRLGDKPLRVRAARGCRPVIRLATERNPVAEPLLDVDAPLTLEGLELQRTAPRFSGGLLPTLLRCGRPPVVLAGCRLLIQGDAVALFAQDTSSLTVHGCEIVSLNWFYPLDWVCPPGGRMTVENTLITGGVGGIAFHYRQSDLQDVSIRLRHNTLAADKPLKFYLDRRPQEQNAKPVRLEASDNVFHARTWVFSFDQSGLFLDENKALDPAAAVDCLRHLLDWREDRNVYNANVSPLGLTVREQPREAPRSKTLNDWKDLWKAGIASCLQGPILYQNAGVRLSGDAGVRAVDFRLRGCSTGCRGGKDGRDLGADVDLVGPGAAYERWRKTAGYRQWLKESGLKEGDG